jgi:hypothetical protein
MAAVVTDANYHEVRDDARATQLTAGAVSTSAVGTISPTTSAGATPTVAIVNATDRVGSFTLSPVTGGGAQAAGEVALVRFAKPYATTPRAIIVQIDNDTDSTSTHVCVAVDITVAGFDISVGAVLVTAKVYNVSYYVIP